MSNDDLRKIAFYHRVQCDAIVGDSPIVETRKKLHTRWAELIEAVHVELDTLRAENAKLREAINKFLTAKRSEHLCVRLNDGEMEAVEMMRSALAGQGEK